MASMSYVRLSGMALCYYLTYIIYTHINILLLLLILILILILILMIVIILLLCSVIWHGMAESAAPRAAGLHEGVRRLTYLYT